ncbi:MAG: acyl carrier protein [Gemmatimonadaceae bacterium]|nr:acyl carrier protein [Gemmatimonadaceae bacterium]
MSQSESEILTKVRAFIEREFLYMRPDFKLNDGDDLMKAGVVDSMGVLEVMNFLDEEFGVTLNDDEITEANLGSLQAIARFVAAR